MADDHEMADFEPEEDEEENPFSDMIDLVSGGSKVLTLEQAKMLGGEPLTEEELDGICPVKATAFRHTELTLSNMMTAAAPAYTFKGPLGIVDEQASADVRNFIKEYIEILVRLQRVRMRRQIQDEENSQ